MNIIETNTNLFYKELNGLCNPEELLKIAKKGIFLHTPLYNFKNIKNHKYIVDISVISNQYFMIFNDNQYKRFVHFLINTNEIVFTSKIIINKFFINKLINENNYDIIYIYFEKLKKKLLEFNNRLYYKIFVKIWFCINQIS